MSFVGAWLRDWSSHRSVACVEEGGYVLGCLKWASIACKKEREKKCDKGLFIVCSRG